MKLREKIAQKRFLMPVLGLIFAFFLCFVNSGQTAAKPLDAPLYTTPLTTTADLIDGTSETLVETTETETPSGESTESETAEGKATEGKTSEKDEETCYDQVKGIGWLVCPTSGVLAKAVDSIYKIISDLLVVQPMTTDSDSPIFIVWQYIRDLTNIVFIILIIVVIYSHLTGVGFDNYNIKKILPKLIITAVLINLSYLICSALVDASNIIGASLRGFFENIESQIGATGDAVISWEAFAAILGGGGAIAGISISAAGGIGAVLPMFILSLISSFLSILVGLATIAMRQAVVSLLVMVAPLAFVCYMLPNTNKWFTKWKDTLSTMLVFFPMFSALFGASHLAGWAIIAKASQDGSLFMTILGMTVQVVPFFLAIPMMKMSGSVLSKASGFLDNLSKGTSGRLRPVAEDYRDTARAKKLDEASRSRNLISGAYWHARFDRNKYLRAEDRAEREENRKNTYATYSNARSTGRTLKRWENGRAIYKTKKDREGNDIDDVRVNSSMRDNYLNRELKLALEADKLKTDNAMSNVDAYLRSTEAKEDKLIKALADSQAQNYLDLRTQQSAKARNDRSDQRFYFEQVQKASEIDKKGNVVNRRLYNQLVKAGAGADAYSDDGTIRQNALTTVTADSYEAYEKERTETSKRYTTLFDTQVTDNVLSQYHQALRNHNIDAVIAAQNTLAKRGDYDKITRYLKNFMDQTDDDEIGLKFSDLGEKGRVKLTEDFTNRLATNLLGMKDAAPILARLGKAINMETWRYTDNLGTDKARNEDYITFKDYVFGHKGGDLSNNQNRTSLIELNYGTSLGKIDRTGFAAVNEAMQYADFTQEDREAFIHSIMPQLISALPGYDSGGESIRSALGFMTGMKYDVDGERWKKDKNLEIDTKSIGLYIESLTDNDLNKFKTDTFNAVCEAIAEANGTTCYVDKGNGKYKFTDTLPSVVTEFLRNKVNKDALAVIQNNVNQGTNVGMKPKVMRAFGIDVPNTLPSTQTN